MEILDPGDAIRNNRRNEHSKMGEAIKKEKKRGWEA